MKLDLQIIRLRLAIAAFAAGDCFSWFFAAGRSHYETRLSNLRALRSEMEDQRED